MKKDDTKPETGMIATLVSNILRFSAALLMGMFVILGILLLFYLWSSHEVRQRLDYGYGTSASPRLVQLEIGDKPFTIPQNHIWSRNRWSGRKVGGVNTHALLPGFEPRTEANENEFEKPGWNKKISLMLSEHNINGSRTSSTSMTRKEAYDRIIKNKKSETLPALYGLTRIHTAPELVGNRELFTGNKHDGSV